MIVDLVCNIMRNHGGICTRLIEYTRKHPSPLLCSVEKKGGGGYVYFWGAYGNPADLFCQFKHSLA